MLEIGSGDGTVASLVAEHVARLVAVDISPSFAAVARETCARHSNVEILEIPPCDLTAVEGEPFDCAWSLNVFIHLNPYESFLYLRQVADRLRPGGAFRFNAAALTADLAVLFRHFAAAYERDPGGLHGYMSWTDLATLRALTAEAGFDVAASTFHQDGGHLWVLARR